MKTGVHIRTLVNKLFYARNPPITKCEGLHTPAVCVGPVWLGHYINIRPVPIAYLRFVSAATAIMASIGAISPTGHPKREWRRIPLDRRLFSAPESTGVTCMEMWSEEENKALVKFVLFHGDPAVWPSYSKKSKFRQEAAESVQQRSKVYIKRSGKHLSTCCMLCKPSCYVQDSNLFITPPFQLELASLELFQGIQSSSLALWMLKGTCTSLGWVQMMEG